MQTYEHFEQFDLPPLPRFKLVVTVKIADGTYVVMPPVCRQLV
jgi:hypothetical protein